MCAQFPTQLCCAHCSYIDHLCFAQAVINMMMEVETMLSPETATADDIEKMSKNAMDAWKDFKNKYELAKSSTESGP